MHGYTHWWLSTSLGFINRLELDQQDSTGHEQLHLQGVAKNGDSCDACF